jgi:sugar lactone lactonase YvrE
MAKSRWTTAFLVALTLSTSLVDVAPARSLAPGVTKANVKEFATHFNKTFSAVLGPLIEKSRTLRPTKGRTSLLDFSLRAAGGTVRAEGFGLLLPQPPKFEISLVFDGIREPLKSGKPLALEGIMQFNFVPYAKGKADGLFRGAFKLGSLYKGQVDVHGEVKAGKVVSLLVTAGNDTYRVGKRSPRPFLSYISTLAGTDKSGNRNGTGAQARFDDPTGVALDDDGNVYVADTNNDSIRKVTPKGAVTTVTKDVDEPIDVGINADGDIIFAQENIDARLARIPKGTRDVVPILYNQGDGVDYCGVILGSCDGRSPIGTASEWITGLDVQGNVIYFTQGHYPPSIRMVLPDGFVMTIRDSSEGGRSGGDCGNAGIVGGNADVAKGNDGNIYYLINQVGCYGVLVLRPDGSVDVVAGKLDEFGDKDGVGRQARFFYSDALEFDGSRYLYVADTSNNLIRRVDVVTGATLRVAGCRPYQPGFDCDGLDPLRDGSMDFAQFYGPEKMDLDEWGDLYVADSGNHAIRVVHIISDPEREPSILRFAPFAVEQGSTSVIEVKGVNLGLTRSASLGDGTTVRLKRAGSKTLFLTVEVSATAAPGPRTLKIVTPYGTAQGPPGLGLEILPEGTLGATVSTIAGTGSWTPGIHDGPADRSDFGLPAGMASSNPSRVLVADPIEHRVRLIATKRGAADELTELLLHASGANEALGSIFASMGLLGSVLQALGAEEAIKDQAEAKIRPVVEDSLEEYCRQVDSPCEWFSLPWAGVPNTRGQTNGFRLDAKLHFPSDVVGAGDGVYFIADSGNDRLRVVGLNPSGDNPQKSPFNLFSTTSPDSRPFNVGMFDSNTALAGLTAGSEIEKVAMKNNGNVTDFLGIENDARCVKIEGDTKQPMGFPMGMIATTDLIYIADPFCQTIWQVDRKTNEITDVRGDEREARADLGTCSDGPMAFATFGAPVDVDVDKAGNIWVADAVCNSVRVIKNLGGEDSAVATKLKGFLDSVSGHLPKFVTGQIEDKINSLDAQFLRTNRWWVLTVAGSYDGESGFVDGPANESRFSTPLGIAAADKDGKTVVFVSDAGNHRIRMISMP